jgi:hypothetical protein
MGQFGQGEVQTAVVHRKVIGSKRLRISRLAEKKYRYLQIALSLVVHPFLCTVG